MNERIIFVKVGDHGWSIQSASAEQTVVFDSMSGHQRREIGFALSSLFEEHLSKEVTVDDVREYMRTLGERIEAVWEWDCEVLTGMLAAVEGGQP